MNRRHDIDWLRVIAIGLLLIYHIAIGFQPWGVFIGFIQNGESLEKIWTPLALLNVFRIPLLFFVSGMGVYFAMARRSWKALLLERAKRILLPFLFGMVAIVPLHVFIWQHYYHQSITYYLQPAHLWFLGNLCLYLILLTPLFYLLKKLTGSTFHLQLQKIMASPIGFMLLVIPFIAEVMIVQPTNFELYALSAHGFWNGLLAFLAGYIVVYSGEAFWKQLNKWKYLMLAIGFSLYIYRINDGDFQSDLALMAIESIAWILAVFGMGYKYLNKPSKALSYLSEAAYPVYIIHMVYLYLGSMLLFPLAISAAWKLIGLIIFTVIGCMVTYEGLIRRLPFLRIAFGLKKVQKAAVNRQIQGEKLILDRSK